MYEGRLQRFRLANVLLRHVDFSPSQKGLEREMGSTAFRSSMIRRTYFLLGAYDVYSETRLIDLSGYGAVSKRKIKIQQAPFHSGYQHN